MEKIYKKISASERLPEKEGYYFVWWKDKERTEVSDCLLFKKGKFFSYEDDEIVTDWLEEVEVKNLPQATVTRSENGQ